PASTESRTPPVRVSRGLPRRQAKAVPGPGRSACLLFAGQAPGQQPGGPRRRGHEPPVRVTAVRVRRGWAYGLDHPEQADLEVRAAGLRVAGNDLVAEDGHAVP